MVLQFEAVVFEPLEDHFRPKDVRFVEGRRVPYEILCLWLVDVQMWKLFRVLLVDVVVSEVWIRGRIGVSDWPSHRNKVCSLLQDVLIDSRHELEPPVGVRLIFGQPLLGQVEKRCHTSRTDSMFNPLVPDIQRKVVVIDFRAPRVLVAERGRSAILKKP